jgi:lon-related putative ATP-dependent protease
MAINTKLSSDQLIQRCEPEQFLFTTTSDLDVLPSIIGQTRAIDAIDFSVHIEGDGYNLFVMGPTGAGKYTLVRRYLDEAAKTGNSPMDWGYLHNFADPQTPNYISLPPGQGKQLHEDIDKVITSLLDALPRALDDEYYRGRLRAIDEASRKHRVRMFGALQTEADKKGILLLRMQDGNYAFAAQHDGEPMTADDFEQLPVDQQEQTEDIIASLHEELQQTLLELREWEHDNNDKIATLNDEVASEVISKHIDKLRFAYPKHLRLQRYFDAMQKDIRSNVSSFLKNEDATEETSSATSESLFRRYQVNLIVDHSESHGAPVIYENLPTHQSILGCVENMAMMGALVTDFSLIKAGAIHRANGGYLILDVEQLLMQPFAWDGLKRALQAKEVRFDTLERMYSLVSTVSLEPEPIPLNLKVILLGDRHLYYDLYEMDPEFAELFKVVADFEDEMPRTKESHHLYARLLATTIRKEGLLHLTKDAVSKVIEYSAREVEDGTKLSLHQGKMTDLLREVSYWAKKAASRYVEREHVVQAVLSRIERINRLQINLYSQIQRSAIRIEVTGSKVGQINALSVLSVGDYSFGPPSKLTATSRYGDGEVLDIEREVELGGELHSKGMMIMSSYLGATYARNNSLSMSASLVFEQNYGEVDGDSATVAELCVLLSSISDIPLKQNIAITGSMNQTGEVQAIGGVNEKIEGFYDVCQRVGFTHEQGVIIPKDNIQHLMLRDDVIDSVSRGEFYIHAVETIAEAMTILTDCEFGAVDENGSYPEGSINAAVARQLQQWVDIHKHDKDSAQDEDG